MKGSNKLNTLQYNLWLNCKNKCKFCYQGSCPRQFNSQEKLISINRFIDILNNSSTMSIYSFVSIIGGEIFDTKLDPEVESRLLDAIDIIKSKLDSGELKEFSINTNLIYKDLTLLRKVIDKFEKDQLHRVCIVTSYDLKYRFHNQNSEDLFLHNLVYLKNWYPNIDLVVQSVITSDFINAVLTNKFNINNFEKTYKCRYNLNNLISSDLVEKLPKSIYPKRQDYINFLVHLSKTNKRLLESFNVDKDDKDFIYCDPEYNKIRVNNTMNQKKLPCGHYETYQTYSDCDKCTLCDVHMVQGFFV